MRRAFILAALLLAAASPAFGQTTSKPVAGQGGGAVGAEQAVLQLTTDWIDAEGRHDRATLERIIADDFLGTAPMGNTVSKRDVLPAEDGRAGGLSMTGQDIKARVFGDTAIVTGRGVGKGQEAHEVRFTVVFVKRAAGWQMVAGHLSGIPRDEQ